MNKVVYFLTSKYSGNSFSMQCTALHHTFKDLKDQENLRHQGKNQARGYSVE
jgi:hypothetical protein